MRHYARPLLLAGAFVTFCVGHAQDNQSLTRDEVAGVKKKLVGVLESLGQPPAGYAMERESFNLPTEAYKIKEGGRYNPMGASATREYGTEKAKESADKDFQKEYQNYI